MITDYFKNAERYSAIPRIEEIKKFIESNDPAVIREGEHEILGRELFVRVASYETGEASSKQFEAHQVYADLQLVVIGSETMEYSLETSKPVTPYNIEADIRFFEEPSGISSVLVAAGQFAYFFPGELHRPGCHPNRITTRVKKLVFKIKIK